MTDPIPYDENDLEVAAKTLWGEARGEGHDGMVAVAWVIRNRCTRPGYAHIHAGDSFIDLTNQEGAGAAVCLAPWQFSCWNKGDPNEPQLEALEIDQYVDQYDIVNDVFNGLIDDPTDGADLYYAPRAMSPPNAVPFWAKNSKCVATIGHQLFFDSRFKT